MTLTNEGRNIMKIEKGNYIRVAEFSNEEIDVFIGLTGIDVNDSDNHSELFSQRWGCYGLNGDGDLVNWGNPKIFGDLIIDEKDITQEFRDYLDALAKEQDTHGDDEWTHVTNSGYKCKIALKEPDANNIIVVLTSDGGYRLHDLKLKPIKPTIKPSVAWSLVSEQGWSIHEVNEKYDVVGKD